MLNKSPKSKTPLWKKLTLGLAAAGTISSGAVLVHPALFFGEQVIKVYDGDSFQIANHQIIRLYGADAPETGRCYSENSTAYLRKLLLGKRVFLRQPVTDIYRRVVALVYLNGELVNQKVIKNGFAVYTRAGESETLPMQKANEFARSHSLGIFSSECYGFTPQTPKCAIKGNIDRDKKQLTYMTPDCPYYAKTAIERFRGEDWFCSEKTALKAGFTKHFTCK